MKSFIAAIVTILIVFVMPITIGYFLKRDDGIIDVWLFGVGVECGVFVVIMITGFIYMILSSKLKD